MYKITLADGTVLENLELNGNNYIAEGVIEDSVFEGNLATERMEKLLSSNADSITDVQVALAEVYEMILGGM